MPVLEDRKSLASRASLLRLYSRSIAEGLRIGAYRSSNRGQGIEFSGVREYLRGDDVRSIDWNVTARMGKAFVKQFEEERELVVFFVVDRSLSMTTGFSKRSRLTAASEAAALLMFAAERLDSPMGAVLFGHDIEFSCKPENGKNQAMLLLSRLDEPPESTAAGSVLSNALRGTAQILKKKSLIFVLSDFRTTGYESELARLALKHDVVAIRITDSSDLELPEIGYVPFYDTESGVQRRLPTSTTSFRRAWRDEEIARRKRWETTCTRRGVTPLILSVDEDPVIMLSRYFGAGQGK